MTPNAVGASEYFQILSSRIIELGIQVFDSLCSDASSRLTSGLALLHFNVTEPRVADRT
jgi:hypothetical protein